MENRSIIDLFMAKKGEWFPPERNSEIRDALSKLDKERLLVVTSIDYKEPTILLIISIFVGGWGVDRFLLGDITMGVLKLITGGGCGIWWLVDLFLITGKTKQYNYQKLTEILSIK